MNTLSAIEFNQPVVAKTVMETVLNEGAAAIHDFMPEAELAATAQALSEAAMYTDTSPVGSRVSRHHDLSRYGYRDREGQPATGSSLNRAPEAIDGTARTIADFILSADAAPWKPNEIIGHRYNPGDFISKHRDFSTALGFIAVLTVQGEQEFYVQQDSGEITEITMKPGTLTIMRGHSIRTPKPRPYHWVAPAVQKRLAVSVRQTDLSWD